MKFDHDATVDALTILRRAQLESSGGPQAAWQIVFHAYARLDAELCAYYHGANAQGALERSSDDD